MRLIFLAILAAALAACGSPRFTAKSDPGYRTYSAEKRHHTLRGFQNVGGFNESQGVDWKDLISDPYSQGMVVPADRIVPRSVVLRQISRAKHKPIAITWIGHSTFLIRLGNKWVLTDPLFGERASPLKNIGPRRSVDAAIRVEDLPPIDIVLVSHNHYDHLDSPALRSVVKRNPAAQILMPLKNGSTARRAGFRHIHELDWFDSRSIRGLVFTSVSAVHSSRRGLLNTNRALWSGWSIKFRGRKIYFAGDTGFGTFIKDIREKLGRHEIALVPIGAYEPQKLESAFHTTPEDAVRLARIIGARHVLPMHWGTIAITTESFKEQEERYLKAAKGMRGARLLKIGETVRY